MAYERKWVGVQAAIASAGPPPCKDCSKRYPGCSGECEGYKAWRSTVEQKKREYLQHIRPEMDANTVRIEAKEHNLREKGYRVVTGRGGGPAKGR